MEIKTYIWLEDYINYEKRKCFIKGKKYAFEIIGNAFFIKKNENGIPHELDIDDIKAHFEPIDKEEITQTAKLQSVTDFQTPNHYDNSKGSIYQFCENQNLNSYEFDIIKRVVRSRKKGEFRQDLEKTKHLIDLYLKEYEVEN